MLLFNTDFLLSDPVGFAIFSVAIIMALVISISFHEFSHAAVANFQGDMTATRMGRLTLDPRKHLDRAGSILMILVGFGWGKPVPVNIYNLRNGRRSLALVSAAGPASNVGVAIAFAALFRIGLLDTANLAAPSYESLGLTGWITLVAVFAIQLNLLLATFNLLPIPPLDGGGILAGIVPKEGLPAVQQLQRYGPAILLVLIVMSYFTDYSPLSIIYRPATAVADMLIGR